MAVHASTLYQLVETKLPGRNLADYLHKERQAQRRFDTISSNLTTITGVAVTPETVRRWVRAMEVATGTEPSYLPGHRREKSAA